MPVTEITVHVAWIPDRAADVGGRARRMRMGGREAGRIPAGTTFAVRVDPDQSNSINTRWPGRARRERRGLALSMPGR